MAKKLYNLPLSLITFCTFLFCLLYSLAGSLVSVIRYRQYEVFYYDFGIFDSAIWRVAHFSPPIIDHFLLGGRWIFADHFNPSIFLLSPLYWFSSNPEILLIAQAICVGMSGYILYEIGKTILKNNLLSLAIVVEYLLFIGVQNAVITDFHEITIAVLPFMLCVLGVVKKNLWLYTLSLIVLLGFKESNFLIGIGIGIFLFFFDKQQKALSVATLIVSVLWGFFAIYYIIPAFSGGIYLYAEHISFNPLTIIHSFFDNAIKRQTLFYSYENFGFLSLFSPITWFLQFQDFFIRMDSTVDARWGLGFHYSVMTGAILSVSSFFGAKYILHGIRWNLFPLLLSIFLICNAVFMYRFILRGPFGLSYNKVFYEHTKDFQFLNRMIEKIPSYATVAAPNNLASHFTHQQVWILRSNHIKGSYDSFEMNKPDYILLDMRNGQNPNDYYGISDLSFMLISLFHEPHYSIFYHNADQYIFKRKS